MSDPGQSQSAVQLPQPSAGLTDADLRHHKQELGVLGSFFGSKENAPFYIAGLTIIGAIICLMIILVFVPSAQDFPKGQAITLFGSIITGALGYIFGKASN